MRSILITGGTGSFGSTLVKTLLEDRLYPEKIIIFSRDEFKQHCMIEELGEFPGGRLRFVLGDIRDVSSLRRAMKGVDMVVHAAALKQVPLCEYNPFQAVKTNILGAQNLIDVSIEMGVSKVLALSTDKAVNPINHYGATKLCAEKLFVSANIGGQKRTNFSCVRYGNVLASRGSVVQLFKTQAKMGVDFTITDFRMTRFWITLGQSVQFVRNALIKMCGGEIFIPKLGSSTVYNLARAIKEDNPCREIGIRPGEKMHEVLISEHEIDRTWDIGWAYAVYPAFKYFTRTYREHRHECKVPDDFRYCSNACTMTQDELKKLVEVAENEEEKVCSAVRQNQGEDSA